MAYVQNEEHFINICCKQLRNFEIIFKNHGDFTRHLSQIYQLSEKIQHLVYKNSLIDTITWQLYQKTERDEIINFFCKDMKEIIFEANRINEGKIQEDFKYLKPIKKGWFLEYTEINTIYENRTISNEAIKELEKLYNCYGIYFIYNDKDQLLYIGKSKNLTDRIPGSIKERKGAKFAYILTKHPGDIHVLEPYLILKYKPIKNTQFMELGNPSFEIELPLPSRIIPFYEENEETA